MKKLAIDSMFVFGPAGSIWLTASLWEASYVSVYFWLVFFGLFSISYTASLLLFRYRQKFISLVVTSVFLEWKMGIGHLEEFFTLALVTAFAIGTYRGVKIVSRFKKPARP